MQDRDHHWRDAKLPSINDSEYQYGSTKSIYDPSPLGFMVPGSTKTDSWSSSFAFITKDNISDLETSSNKGRTLIDDTTPIFFPASGYRKNSDGTLYGTGTLGYYWSASFSDADNAKLFFFGSFSVNIYYYTSRSSGCSVRPIKE